MARATRHEWAKRVDQWRRSGLTAKQFAARAGISARSLSWWKWQLARGARTAPPVVEVVGTLSRSVGPFELVLDERVQVRIPADFDPESLRRLLAVLEAR